MKIYPKTNSYLEGLDKLLFQIKETKGIEIQFFHKDKENLIDFGMKETVDELMKRCPYIEEVIIHPPLAIYELETVIIKDKNIFLNQIKDIIELSQKYNIKVNIVEHTRFVFRQIKMTYINVLKEALLY